MKSRGYNENRKQGKAVSTKVVTIREVSEKYQIPVDTLRYYERVGVIPPVTRTASGTRNYQEEDIQWVETAKCLRAAGLPVAALVEYLRLYRQGPQTIGARLELLTQQRKLLLEQERKLRESLQLLEGKIARYQAAAESGHLDLSCQKPSPAGEPLCGCHQQ